MVKGVSRRVVVVKAPASDLFEEAIFILRDDADNSSVDANNVLQEACNAAGQHVYKHCRRRKKRPKHIPAPAFAAAGAALTGAAWLMYSVIR